MDKESIEYREKVRAMNPEMLEVTDLRNELWAQIEVLNSTLDSLFDSPYVDPSKVSELMAEHGRLNARFAGAVTRLGRLNKLEKQKRKLLQVSPTGKRNDVKEVVREFVVAFAAKKQFRSVDELYRACKDSYGVGSVGMINKVIAESTELTAWREAKARVSQSISARISDNIDGVVVDHCQAEESELMESFVSTSEFRQMPVIRNVEPAKIARLAGAGARQPLTLFGTSTLCSETT